MESLINEIAELISKYNSDLAKAWRNQPFRRTLLANAFEAGFPKPNALTEMVKRAARLDVKFRQDAARKDALTA